MISTEPFGGSVFFVLARNCLVIMKRMRYTGAMHLRPILSLLLLAFAASVCSADDGVSALCNGLKKSAARASKAKKDPDAAKRAKGLHALGASIRQIDSGKLDVNHRSKKTGMTALMVATALGEKDAVRWLVAKGADPSVKDASGRDCFSRTTDEEVMALLKEGGVFSWEEALPLLEKYPCGSFWVQGGWATLAKTNELGFKDLEAVAPDMQLMAFIMRQAEGGVNSLTGSNRQAPVDILLHPKLTHGQCLYLLNLMQAHGADFSQMSLRNLIAGEEEKGDDTLPYIKWLVEHGAQVTGFTDDKPVDGMQLGHFSNLLAACTCGDVECVRFLLEQGTFHRPELEGVFGQLETVELDAVKKQEISKLLQTALGKAGK